MDADARLLHLRRRKLTLNAMNWLDLATHHSKYWASALRIGQLASIT